MKSFALLIASLFFVLVLASVFLKRSDPCSNQIKAEVKSPDGKFVATAFIRDCGATTSFSPQVHLRPIGEDLATTGNVFIGDDSQDIQVIWLSATQLAIYSDCRTIQHITNFHGVTIEKKDIKK